MLALLAEYLGASAIAIWVLIDSRERARALSYDFGSWVFLLPLFVGPYYVFSTRGLRAFALLGKFLLVCLAGTLVGMIPLLFGPADLTSTI